MVLTGIGNLANLLPTGTVLVFQFFNPLLTNNGVCHRENKYAAGFLIGIGGIFCFISSFTDSYVTRDGTTYHGIATTRGLWPNPNNLELSFYRLKFRDFVHALSTLFVFAVISLLDSNTVKCYYPSFETQDKVLIMVLPPVIGGIASIVFARFPSTRNGIGYPSTPNQRLPTYRCECSSSVHTGKGNQSTF